MAPQKDDNRSPTTTLAAMMMGLSLLAMITPLAVYHAGQIAAAAGLRRAVVLLAGVTLGLVFLGLVVVQPVLFLAGIHAFVWFIPIAAALALRERCGKGSLFWASLALASLPLMALALLLIPPPVADFAALLQDTQDKLLEAASQTPSTAPPPPSGATALDAERLAEQLKQWAAAPEMASLKQLFESSRPDRALWLIFGQGGSSWTFALMLMAAGNLVLLDLAFEQVEKLRAALRFITMNPGRFSPATATSAPLLARALAPGRFEAFEVVRVSAADTQEAMSSGPSAPSSRPWHRLLRPAGAVDELNLMGSRFKLRAIKPINRGGSSPDAHPEEPGSAPLEESANQPAAPTVIGANPPPAALWRLRNRRMPLPLALASVAALLAAGFVQTSVSPEHGALWGTPTDPGTPSGASGLAIGGPLSAATSAWLAVLAALGLAGSTWLAIEGVLVVLARVKPLLVLALLILAIFAGPAVAANPLLVVAVLGTVGLLDHLYDFRKTREPGPAGKSGPVP